MSVSAASSWDSPDSDPVADIEAVLAKGFAEGLGPSPTIYVGSWREEEVTRVDGHAECPDCGKPYRDHRCIADGGFRRACDGRLVKT